MLLSFFTPVTYAAGGAIASATPLSRVLLNALDFLLSVVGIIGILGVGVAGILYLTASGNEQRIQLAKRALYASVTGLVIALAALVVMTQLGTFFS